MALKKIFETVAKDKIDDVIRATVTKSTTAGGSKVVLNTVIADVETQLDDVIKLLGKKQAAELKTYITAQATQQIDEIFKPTMTSAVAGFSPAQRIAVKDFTDALPGAAKAVGARTAIRSAQAGGGGLALYGAHQAIFDGPDGAPPAPTNSVSTPPAGTPKPTNTAPSTIGNVYSKAMDNVKGLWSNLTGQKTEKPLDLSIATGVVLALLAGGAGLLFGGVGVAAGLALVAGGIGLFAGNGVSAPAPVASTTGTAPASTPSTQTAPDTGYAASFSPGFTPPTQSKAETKGVSPS